MFRHTLGVVTNVHLHKHFWFTNVMRSRLLKD